MSVPHTGKLSALVNGYKFTFDGNTWTTAERSRIIATFAQTLNAATADSPKHHFDIRDLAEHVLRKLGMDYRILSWEPDAWPDDDPTDGVD